MDDDKVYSWRFLKGHHFVWKHSDGIRTEHTTDQIFTINSISIFCKPLFYPVYCGVLVHVPANLFNSIWPCSPVRAQPRGRPPLDHSRGLSNAARMNMWYNVSICSRTSRAHVASHRTHGPMQIEVYFLLQHTHTRIAIERNSFMRHLHLPTTAIDARAWLCTATRAMCQPAQKTCACNAATQEGCKMQCAKGCTLSLRPPVYVDWSGRGGVSAVRSTRHILLSLKKTVAAVQLGAPFACEKNMVHLYVYIYSLQIADKTRYLMELEWMVHI